MQFSLKAMMIAILLLAVIIVSPFRSFHLLELIVWCLLPVVLVGRIQYGNSQQRTFATGSLAALATATLLHGELLTMNTVLRWLLMAGVLWLGGWLMTYLAGHPTGPSDSPIPPPPPGE
jgi:hypothetical protein